MHDPCPQPGLGSRHSGRAVGVHVLGSECVPEGILLGTRVVRGCVNGVCWWLSQVRAGNRSVGGLDGEGDPGEGPWLGGEPLWEGILGGQGGLQEGDLAGQGVLGGLIPGGDLDLWAKTQSPGPGAE